MNESENNNNNNNNNYNNSGQDDSGRQGDYNRYRASIAKKSMATAALVLAVIACVTFQFFFLSLPLAGSAVILALLSRNGKKIEGRSKIALFAGVAAAIISCVFTWYMFRTVYNDPQLRRQVEQLYDYYSGQFSASEDSGDTSGTEDPQALISDILSGRFRENQKSGSASKDAIPENGGSFI
ncbi:MAG: hypothetical protein K6C06_09020 [Lachnospiraceae bacterium]|nr:hypothetical protein [Lachnospiraceae bacterium]